MSLEAFDVREADTPFEEEPMSEVLVGKFGPLSLAESEAMRALAKAWALAERGSWQEGRLMVVMVEECRRLGLVASADTFA